VSGCFEPECDEREEREERAEREELSEPSEPDDCERRRADPTESPAEVPAAESTEAEVEPAVL